jgi:hypothetical protein
LLVWLVLVVSRAGAYLLWMGRSGLFFRSHLPHE